MKPMKTAHIIILLFLISLVVFSPGYCQFFSAPKQGGNLFGNVIGPSGLNTQGARYAPIEGATVTIKSPHHTTETITDYTGGFQFANLPAGEYSVMINKPGYGPYVEKVEVKEGGIHKMSNISLIPGGGLTTAAGVIVPDTVYVAFAKMDSNKYASQTNMWKKGAIMQGADPFALEGNNPQAVDRGVNPYDQGSQISAYDNSLMTIDPKDANKLDYVKLDGRPTWLQFNIAGTKLYVATDQNYVLIYDVLANNILIGSISIPSMATDMALSPDGNFLFISYSTGGVMVVDTRTHAPVNNIELPPISDGSLAYPADIEVSRDGMRIFVALSSATSGEVVCIDAYSKQPVGSCMVGAQPVGMALSPDGSRLYVANKNSADVAVVSTSPVSLISRNRVGVSPTKLAVTPDGRKVFVSCAGSNEVTVLSSMGSAIGNINVGSEPMGIAVTSDGTRCYVANKGDGTVSVIDVNANYVIKTTRAQPHSQPFGIAIKP